MTVGGDGSHGRADPASSADERGGRVTLEVFPEQKKLGALLSNAAGGPSTLCYALCGLCPLSGLLFLVSETAEDSSTQSRRLLLCIVASLIGLGFAALALTVSSARGALRLPGGQLDELGVETATVSAEDATSIARWRKGLLGLSALFALFGVAMWLLALGVIGSSSAFGAIDAGSIGFVCLPILPIALSGWWASMRTAGCLCRDLATETIENVRTTDPKNEEEWEAKVNRPALALVGKFELLSDGWSGGLVGVGGLCWLFALGLFALGIELMSINDVDFNKIGIVAFFALLPLPLAWDIAGTSSCCDELMAELNKARIKHGEEVHLKIHCLETALKQLVRRAPLLGACSCLWFYV
eukprot:COSAG04_NODE_1004_length_8828_cov_2.256357_4_plen_356_part_00